MFRHVVVKKTSDSHQQTMLFIKCVIVVKVKLFDQILNSPITLIHVPEALVLNWRPRGSARPQNTE